MYLHIPPPNSQSTVYSSRRLCVRLTHGWHPPTGKSCACFAGCHSDRHTSQIDLPLDASLTLNIWLQTGLLLRPPRGSSYQPYPLQLRTSLTRKSTLTLGYCVSDHVDHHPCHINIHSLERRHTHLGPRPAFPKQPCKPHTECHILHLDRHPRFPVWI
jgi:hypothetical protein